MDQARYQLLLHSVGAGLAQPIDTVFANISDLDGLSLAAVRARGMGFDGMLCIHPTQLSVVAKVYAPAAHELE
jgi:(S)-citramalyl-CoA lyase